MSDETPKVLFAGEWIPAHEVWKKMETATVAADVIDSFNQKFPHLASEFTEETVRKVRKRLGDIELVMPKKAEKPDDHADEAARLLQEMPPEDVLDHLAREFNQEMSLEQLISLVGEAEYKGSLCREAAEYEQNRILPEQTAQIWNEMHRPVPGGGLWNAFKVRELLEG